MAFLEDQQTTNTTTTDTVSEDNEVGTFQSIMAGIGSGLFKIPEGLFSLGATLIDLGADTNKAAEVEEYFAKINPFDEMAEATTAGKITELVTNLAIPGGVAFKLANTAVKASKGGNYLNITGNAGKNINNGIKKTLNKKIQDNICCHLSSCYFSIYTYTYYTIMYKILY